MTLSAKIRGTGHEILKTYFTNIFRRLNYFGL